MNGRSEPTSGEPSAWIACRVGLTVSRILREIVVKGGVDDAIRQGRSTAQAFQIFQIAAMHLGTRVAKKLRARL
jgi:hypothetical protein